VVNPLALRPRSVGFACPATILLGSNLEQVVYSHCLPRLFSPRNWGTKGSFRIGPI